MKDIRIGAWYTSSVDPEKIGSTVKGFLFGITAIILFLASYFKIPLTDMQWFEIATEISAAISAGLVAFGIIQKVFIKVEAIVVAFKKSRDE